MPTPRAVLAVDGNSLGHRAYHSVQDAAPGDDRPLVTGALISMLASAWVHGPYDAVLVGFDHPVNRRKELEPAYKANRPPTPRPLTAALQVLREHLRSCGFHVVEHEGAEADYVLAATSDACTGLGWRCDLLSSDRDLTALVGPQVRLLRPRARFADLVVEDEALVRATYGVDPAGYVELAALRGDDSDGLQGARGIGAKTAARLLHEHGSIGALYDALSDLPPRIEASLREARARVERNLLLMAPVPHLDVRVEELTGAVVDPDRVLGTLEPLGLADAARRFVRALAAPPAPPSAPHPADGVPRADEPPPEGSGHMRARRLATASEGEQESLF